MKKSLLTLTGIFFVISSSCGYGMNAVRAMPKINSQFHSTGLTKNTDSMNRLANADNEAMEVEPSVPVVPQVCSTSSIGTSTAQSTQSQPSNPTASIIQTTELFWQALQPQSEDLQSALILLSAGAQPDLKTISAEDALNKIYSLVVYLIKHAHKENGSNPVDLLKKLITLGLKVNAHPNKEISLLDQAINRSFKYTQNITIKAIIKELIAAGADITTLVQGKDKQTFEVLLACGVDATKMFTIFSAIPNDRPENLFEILLKAGASISEFVKANKIDDVKWLIQHGAQLNHPANVRLLHSAALRNLHKMVDLLLEAGIDPKKKDPDHNDETAISGAIQFGHTSMIQKLANAKVPIYTKGSPEELLIGAVQENNAEKVHALLEGQDAPRRARTNLINKQGEHILSIALKNKSAEIIVDLLNHGCSLNLLAAINDVEAVATLLELKAEYIDADLAQEATELLQIIPKKTNVAMVRVLIHYGASIRAVVFDEQQRLKADYETLELLLQAGAIKTSNVMNCNGDTINEALKKAVYTKGGFEIVALLLSYGASIQSALFDDKNNFIATKAAFELLLEAGAAKTSPSNKNTLNNVLQLATAGKNTQIIALLEEHGITNQNTKKNRALSEELLRSGASEIHIETSLGTIESLTSSTTQHQELVNAKDEQKNTPLHYAAQRNTIAIIREMKISDEELETAEETSKSALKKQTEEAIKLLVNAHADIDTQNNNGDTPLLLAVKQSNMAAIKTLLALGANPFIANNMGDTSLSIAQLYRHEDILDEVKSGTAARLALLNSRTIRNCCVSTCAQ